MTVFLGMCPYVMILYECLTHSWYSWFHSWDSINSQCKACVQAFFSYHLDKVCKASRGWTDSKLGRLELSWCYFTCNSAVTFNLAISNEYFVQIQINQCSLGVFTRFVFFASDHIIHGMIFSCISNLWYEEMKKSTPWPLFDKRSNIESEQ